MELTRFRAVDPGYLAPAQRHRLDRFKVGHCVDIHCHCLPCLDDGPESLVTAVELCRALVADGVTAAIATPHQLGRYHGKNEPAAVREAVAALNRTLLVEGVPLHVFPGADVRIDERIDRLIADDGVLTLADGRTFLLLELPHDTFIDPLPLMHRLTAAGITPILSHPERHAFVTGAAAGGTQLLERWASAGATMQVTAGSILGDFGPVAARAAGYWLEAGLVGLVASDAHNATRRPPRLSRAIDKIVAQFGEATARRVCIENPARVLEGLPLLGPSRRPHPDEMLAGLDDL
jgi:protein-tyrosine phosphatase